MFGATPVPAVKPHQYGYDLQQKKWGWGTRGASGFSLPGGPAGAGTGSKSPAEIITDIINQGTGAVPEALRVLGSQSTNTMTSTTGVSQPVQQAADNTAGYITNLIGQGNPEYTGQRVASLSAPEQQVQDFQTRSLAGQGGGTAGVQAGQNTMIGMAAGTGGGFDAMRGALGTSDTSGLDAAAGPVQTQKLTDVDMAGYVNPAQNAIYDSILRGNEVTKNAIRARQARAGAFGENSSVAQSLADDSTKRNLALAGADAFKIAQGAAAGDVAAENAGRQSNRNASMTAAQQKVAASLTDKQRALAGGQAINADMMTGAGGAVGAGSTLHNMGQQSAAGAAAAGATARSVEQAGHDANWEQYLQRLGFGLNLAQTASGALGNLPGLRTTATTQLGPSAAGQQIGALIGLTGLQEQYGQPQRGGMTFSAGNIRRPAPAASPGHSGSRSRV